MDGYDRGGHTKYSLKAHLIFVTKYRKHIFTRKMHAECVKQFLYDAAKVFYKSGHGRGYRHKYKFEHRCRYEYRCECRREDRN